MEGYVHPDFSEVATALSKQVGRRRRRGRGAGFAEQGGAAVCVYHRGEKVADVWVGSRDAQGAPWREDTMAMSFSTTKGVMSTAVHLLADRGLIDYDAPVADYWPEFAAAGKESVTVRHVLSHQAGLYRIRGLVDSPEQMGDWEHMIHALENCTPAHKPGESSGYHAITYGWLTGELIIRASGRPLREFIADELAAPLGLDGFFIGAPASGRERIATLIYPGAGGAGESNSSGGDKPAGRLDMFNMSPAIKKVVKQAAGVARSIGLDIDPSRAADALMVPGIADAMEAPEMLEQPIPAVNGIFTARSLARMYAALAGGGELDGTRLLSESTLREATVVQSTSRDKVVIFPMRWRLGYHVVGTSRGILPNAFGHFGYGGSGAWADPDRDLAVALVVNRVAGTPFGDTRLLKIGSAAVRAADRREGDGARYG